MPLLTRVMTWLSDAVWGPWNLGPPVGQVPGPLVLLLLAVGLFLTLRCRFVQIRRFPEAARTIIPKPSGSRGVLSPFQAFMTALAASIGTGNIAGVATAVVAGGPGAVFWIWCYGFFATSVKFAEAVLGVSFRGSRDGTVLSGPMYYLRDGLKSPRLAWAYALIAGVAALTTTPFTQPNSIAVAFQSEFSVNPWVSGVVIAVLTWLVIIGGVKSIGRAVEKLSPVKVGLYLAGGLFVIIVNAARLPDVFAAIFREAFSLRAATGTAAGMALMVGMRYGLARGVYANEAGYGTAAVAYGTARSDYPAQQGLNAVIEVFTVSFVTSSISALTILVTGVWTSGLNSTAVVARAFDSAIPVAGGGIVAVCSFLFGYTTLIGWAYYGEQFFEYILGARVTRAYRWTYCLLIVFGAAAKVETVWAWGDLMNGLQVFPNVVGLLGLSGFVAAVASEPSREPRAKGREPRAESREP